MKRWHLLLVLALMLLLGTAATAQAESYTEFCTLDAQFTWLESVSVHTEPYTSSPTTGKTVAAGDVVFIQRLVKNEYGNLWAELFTGGYLCFYDKASDKECASFVSISNGAAPVTTSKISAPEGEIVQGTSFTFSGILDSSSVCPIFLFDIWCGVGGGHAFDEHISSWPSGVTTKIDITDYNINELYDISTLPPGEYNYTIRVWIGFTYEGHQFAFGDKYVPVQKTFTIVEKPTSYTVPSGSLSTKLSYLRKVFPNGWYWNHWSASDLGSTYTQKSFTINGHSTSITNKPCSKDSPLHANVSNSTCNHYWGSWKGVQCLGFARMMFELVWDMDTETESYGMYYHPDTDNADLLDYVKPGDMIWTGGHAFLVTSVNGDTFTVVHCNRNSNCNIEWDYTYTKDWVHARMKGNKTGYVASPTPIVYGSGITNWAKYKVVTSSLNVRKWASTSVDKSCTMQEGDYFYVDLNHTITKNGNLYGYCRTADGKYGWVQFSNTSYAVPVEEDCEHANTEWVTVEPATCTEPGAESLICSDCGEVLRTDPLLPDGHTCDWRYTKEPTCTEKGEGEVYCTACGLVLETETIPAKGHTEGYWVVITEATATATGLKRQSCTVCGVMLAEEVIPVKEVTPLANITMSAGANLTAVPGGTVTVPVGISNPDGVSIAQITLELELPVGVTMNVDSVSACGTASSFSLTKNVATIIMSSSDGNALNGHILNIPFTIASTVQLPTEIVIRSQVISFEEDLVNLPSIVATVEEALTRIPGDVTNDGVVDGRDSVRLLKYLAHWDVTIHESNSDVTGDGLVDGRDSVRLLKYLAHWDVVLK